MSETAFVLPGEWKDFDGLVALQDKQLGTLLEHASRSPFYQRRISGRFPRDRAGLDGVPLTTKEDLRNAYPFGLLAVGKERLATYHESSGTSGRPTASYYTADDWTDLAERYARKWVGIYPYDVFLVRTPYALMITGHLAHAAARMAGATVVPGDNRSLAMPYARVVRVMHELGVTLTWSMATETLIWAAAAEAAGWRPGSDFPALRALFIGGEPVTAARRTRISRIWGVPVVEEYGSTETGSLAGECAYGRLHLWADRVIGEVYHPETGTTTPEGRGQLVVTPIRREAMPLLRYNLEDTVELSYEDCECGWALPVIRVFGRSAFAYRSDGADVTQHGLEELVFGLPERYGILFWRAKAEDELLRVEIEVRPEFGPEAEAGLSAAIRSRFGIRSEVRGVAPGSLVPHGVLTANQDVTKPRSLFGPGEDWDKAVLYY